MFTTEFTTELGFTESNIGWVSVDAHASSAPCWRFRPEEIFAKLWREEDSLVITAISLIVGAAGGAACPRNAADDALSRASSRASAWAWVPVVGPAAVASIVPARKQGLAMGIWSVWFPAGVVLAMNVDAHGVRTLEAPGARTGGSRRFWPASLWSSCCWSIATPPQEDAPQETAEAGSAPMKLKPDFFSIVMIAIAFGCWNVFDAGADGGFYPAYLADVHRLSAQAVGHHIQHHQHLGVGARPHLGHRRGQVRRSQGVHRLRNVRRRGAAHLRVRRQHGPGVRCSSSP